MHTYSLTSRRKIKKISACQKDDDNCFVGQGRSADGGIHATMDNNNAISVYQTLNNLRRAIQNKRCGMLTYGVVLLHDNALPHTAGRTRALLEHFN
jgi:hypothetical protein